MMKAISWKESKKYTMEKFYGKYLKEFEGYSDDRKIYCNTYAMIMKALESLQDDPECYVRCAMNQMINNDMGMMDRIILRFHFGEE